MRRLRGRNQGRMIALNQQESGRMAMKEFVEYMAAALVDEPNRVRVVESTSPHSVVLELHVAPDDVGRVIGKGGRVANAMRNLLRVAALREGTRVTLEIG